MTNEQYMQAQNHLMIMGEISRSDDWNEFIQRINDADNIGAVLDPTLYRAAMERLPRIKEMARHALHLKIAFEQFQEQVKLEMQPKEYNP